MKLHVLITTFLFLPVLLIVDNGWAQVASQQSPVQVERLSPVEQQKAQAVEDTVAQRFLQFRDEAGLKPLKRIRKRTEVRQLACTLAVRGNPDLWVPLGRAFSYTSSDLAEAPELENAAKFQRSEYRKLKVRPKISRFSVAAWPSRDPKLPPGTWSVVIGLFPSRITEFFENYFTDHMFYRNEWKKQVAPECRQVQ